MTPLHALTFPFSGHSLIEASAGTGKTYTIVNLYVRLIVGHQTAPLTADQILVVTFTNAATAELKQRIFERLKTLYQALEQDSYTGNDAFFQALIPQLTDKALAKQRVFLAQKQMDIAPVLTIHGFCHSLLNRYGLESGIEFGRQLELNDGPLIAQAVEDFWRKHLSTLSPDALELVLTIWPEPLALQQAVAGFISRDFLLIGNSHTQLDTVLASAANYSENVASLKRWWREHQVADQLKQANLNGRAKLAKPQSLMAMEQFVSSSSILFSSMKESWALFSADAVEKARKKDSHDLSHLDFSQFDALAEELAALLTMLEQTFFAQALTYVRNDIQTQKRMQGLVSSDDLLQLAKRAVENNTTLSRILTQAYPVALVDEFQDTDPTQFALFEWLYWQSPAAQLIMIGDPKQAIYSFRGADIFTYLHAKQRVADTHHYALDTNWRSSDNLIKCVNAVFEHSEYGFLFNDSIPFYGVKGSGKSVSLTCGTQHCSPLVFDCYLPEEDANKPVSWTQAKQVMSDTAAERIVRMLSGDYTIDNRPVTASDICVLVRDKQEAEAIKLSLSRRGVYSAYQARVSVFSTQTAQDLFFVLSSLAQPSSESAFKAALLTELMGITGQQLCTLLDDDSQWQRQLNALSVWHNEWNYKGIMLALQVCFEHFDVFSHLAANFDDGARRITDLRHLMELLQNAASGIEGQKDLLAWYEKQLRDPDHAQDSQQLRLESDENLVQIVTMHSSKGLQYPIVLIPFASRFRSVKENLYHDEAGQLVFDIASSPGPQAHKERLAEDIRLFYVGMTRAMYFCCIGLWNPLATPSRTLSAMNQCAIGHLLLGNTPFSQDALTRKLGDLSKEVDLDVCYIEPDENFNYLPPSNDEGETLSCRHFRRDLSTAWRVTSYSAMSKTRHHGFDHSEFVSPEPGFDESRDDNIELTPELNRFAFPKGANPGSFLHDILERLDFSQPEALSELIQVFSLRYSIDECWHSVLMAWVIDVLQTPLVRGRNRLNQEPKETFNLSDIARDKRVPEMAFFLPLKQVSCEAFNRILRQAFPEYEFNYGFEKLNGMLKGFMDLVFEHDGAFYVADYKSNYLGDRFEDYHEDALENAMVQHDYLLQAILYTVALHRFLKLNLINYHYEEHMGGAYYLFLRGMNGVSSDHGVFTFRASQNLIEQLDACFDGASS